MDLSCLDQFKASALLDPTSASPSAPGEMDLSLIDFDESQPRRSLDERELVRLAASIREHGVLEPVSLRCHPNREGRYVVNRGERRVRACRMAGLRTVPWFADERVDPYAQAVENLQREDLSPFDLARFVAEREAGGDSRAAIARKLHKPASFISEIATLVDAPEEVRAAFESGRARDTRVLYQLMRRVRRQDPASVSLLQGEGPITRASFEDRPRAGRSPAPAAPSSVTVVRPNRRADALLVDHGGRRGRLLWTGWPGRRTGEVHFDDGSRQVLDLAELKLLTWTVK